MIFITGETTGKKTVEIIRAENWGRMFVEKKPTPYEGEPWGFDNGAYGWWIRGEPFNEELYKKRLDRAYHAGKPYLAITPDIVGEGENSLGYSLAWIERLPSEWAWYLAVQDGMTADMVETIIDKFSGLFLGGTNHFKSKAYFWKRLAHRHGKKFHYGRAGTARKIQDALMIGADSADSAFPLWTHARLAETIRYVNREEEQGSLFPLETIFATV